MNDEKTRCPGCGMGSQSWKGSAGRGYALEGEAYCCRGCAEGSGCMCESSIDAPSVGIAEEEDEDV
jgi:hypothetical protein